MTTTVHLLRHGEVHNPDRVLYGRLPGYRLSELGERQAEVSAAWLAERGVTYLVASPLQRAQQTAEALARLTGLGVGTDDRLVEAGNVFEGQQLSGVSDLVMHPSRWGLLRNPLRPSWGEPYQEIAARMLAAARAARDAAGDGGAAVCVSHQLPIVSAARTAEGLRLFHDPRRRRCSLASVTSLTYDGDVIVRVDYAEPAVTLRAGDDLSA